MATNEETNRRHIFNILNQTSLAKGDLDNWRCLCKDQVDSSTKEKKIFWNEYERFRAIGNVSIKTTLAFPTSFLLGHYHPPYKPAPDFFNSKTHATVHDVQIGTRTDFRGSLQRRRTCLLDMVKNPVERWTLSTSKIKPYMMEAKDKGDVLDAKLKHILDDTDKTNVNQERMLRSRDLKIGAFTMQQEIISTRYPKGQLDLLNIENKVRLEQASGSVKQRNLNFVQENDLLKSTLSGKEKSIAFLQSEKEKILSEKKDLAR
ncbi:hypothetical protein Tco_0121633 [Tanacetum coccineum]